MPDVILDITKTLNIDKLDEDIRATFLLRVSGISTHADKMTVHFVDNPTIDDQNTVQAILDTHDAAVLTVKQQNEVDANTAQSTLSELLDARIAWHEANGVDGTNQLEFAQRLQTEWVYFLKILRRDIG